ncbi:Mfa1 family fimbria major subunit [Muribaculum intestinale]|uniref:Mfa1 family fimbria major subunit n=1 Tax=Muribaculum intestinale TaxID=1796646 RepID=UPI00351439EC
MKPINYLSMAVAVLAMGGFTACSDDTIEVDAPDQGNGIVEVDGAATYMQIAISDPSTYGGRAITDNDFDYGDASERAIKDFFLFFYDQQGRLIGEGQRSLVAEWTLEAGSASGSHDDMTDKYTRVVKVVQSVGESKPYYVVCIANPTSALKGNDANFATTDLIRTVARNGFLSDDKNFIMSNSVYFDENNIREMATRISIDQLYDTEQAAKDSKKPVDVYIERMAAKVTLTATGNTGSNNTIPVKDGTLDIKDENGNPIKLTFVLEGWGVNNEEKTSWLVKNFLDENNNHMFYDVLKEGLSPQGQVWWNSPTNHRSYWATTPSYWKQSASDFPENVDKWRDDEDGKFETDHDWALNYKSYQEILEACKDMVDGVYLNKSQYCMEHTISSVTINLPTRRNAATPSVVVIGRYKIADAAAYTDFYKYDDGNGVKLYLEGAMISKWAKPQNIIKKIQQKQNESGDYVDEWGDPEDLETADYAKIFKLEHPRKAVRGNELVPARFVTMQLADDLKGDMLGEHFKLVYLSGSSSEGAYKVLEGILSQTLRDDLDISLYQYCDLTEKFEEGRCYYNIPVEHNYTAPAAGSEDTSLKAGDYGIVRNHVYRINITQITGIGNGVGNKNEPIIVQSKSKENFIKTRINILPWKIVTQSAELKPLD